MSKNDESSVKNTAKAQRRAKKGITASSTAEYFSKNLQQVGFSSATKAVLTTVKEALDNSLDACEENRILPDIVLQIEKLGAGSLKNTDRIRIYVEDNGPGIGVNDIAKVFGEYLASSKFGRGRCSRGQQGIGISAATTWALQTTATGAKVVSKQKSQRKATQCVVEMDLKNNKGILKNKESIDWKGKSHGTSVEFLIDGRIQLNGEAGLINYIKGNVLVNPHMTITYQLPGMDKPETIERVSKTHPNVPDPVDPHPHTMKLGEFLSHAKLFGKVKTRAWLRKGFSRISDKVVDELVKAKAISASKVNASVTQLTDQDIQKLYAGVQHANLMAPSTNSVLSIGEEALSKSILRIGEIDFFSVVTRKPTICDFKPVQIEIAIARLLDRNDNEDPAHILRFANRVPLQFDKGGCAIVKAINSVNWRSYGLRQPKGSLPTGPYIISVSLVSPFIKFKNASKETVDASDELVEEIRRALMQGGQRLSRHIRREAKENELENKIQHIEKFGPILVETLARIVGAKENRKIAAEEGLRKILGRDAKSTEKELKTAEAKLSKQKAKRAERLGVKLEELEQSIEPEDELPEQLDETEDTAPEAKTPARKPKKVAKKKTKKPAKKTTKKKATKSKTKKTTKKKTTKKSKPSKKVKKK